MTDITDPTNNIRVSYFFTLLIYMKVIWTTLLSFIVLVEKERGGKRIYCTYPCRASRKSTCQWNMEDDSVGVIMIEEGMTGDSEMAGNRARRARSV